MSVRRRLRFVLHISADEYLAFYQGGASKVFTETLEGRSLQFPANILRPFVTREGIHGIFELEFDEHNKVVDIRRLDR